MSARPAPLSPPRAWFLVGALVLGYIGIYLCRKNFSVAVPLIREDFSLSKENIGQIASYSTLAYMLGKFAFGPLIDRAGGRAAFLASLLAVAVFGGLGGLVGSFPMLALVYSLNRLAGSAGWGGMVKLVPDWLPPRSLPLAMAVLSLGFVFGGVCATLLAGQIAEWSGNNWRWVMGGPALVLAAILIGCWLVLPRVAPETASDFGALPAGSSAAAAPAVRFEFRHLRDLLFIRRFWILLALSFVLTLLRETFNTWTVDFFKTSGGGELSTRIAAFLSTPFDAFGAAGILALGWAFGRLGARGRMRLLVTILGGLAGLIWVLPELAERNLWLATAALGGVGFLAYGPYSLLAGILAVEIRGKAYVGTVAGLVDGVGYLAAILAGRQFGRILDVGGYGLGFTCLAALAAVAAVLCLFLYRRGENPGEIAASDSPPLATGNVAKS
ncbi:MAG: MFS transporter [Verrucomicrobia bacterium]|nr:MFS transporter [Verrucomicrobiota bacterium]